MQWCMYVSCIVYVCVCRLAVLPGRVYVEYVCLNVCMCVPDSGRLDYCEL